MSQFDSWVGREERATDVLGAGPAHLLAASLDRRRTGFAAGDELPPVWHWLYFLQAVRTADVGHDGHPPKGGFLPPVPLPRRMRAGGQFEFHRPLRIGERAQRCSRILSVEEKRGGSGQLVFVRVQHEITVDGSLAVVEQESLVYRDAPPPGSTRAAPPRVASAGVVEPHERRFQTNEVLLFRYSALTFNCHRIHYDRNYAVETEGYPDLVVQGPLIALMMLEHMHSQRPASALGNFSYRAVAPVFCGEDVAIGELGDSEAGVFRIKARNSRGVDAVVGEAQYRN
jgi:3-methylfumaryl-CoA hydratase